MFIKSFGCPVSWTCACGDNCLAMTPVCYKPQLLFAEMWDLVASL